MNEERNLGQTEPLPGRQLAVSLASASDNALVIMINTLLGVIDHEPTIFNVTIQSSNRLEKGIIYASSKEHIKNDRATIWRASLAVTNSCATPKQFL